MITFDEIGLKPEILKGLKEIGFEHPMPVQEEVIPVLLQTNRDLVGLAQTGTGKTAAFGLPLIDAVDVSNKKTQALILCPTRELCLQIANDLTNFSKYVNGFNVVAVYGGASIDGQVRELKKGAHIIVATPGRMLDLIRRGSVKISSINSVVLDEADEMLNMGFQEDLNDILAETPDTKRTLLFSATMPKEVSAIAKNYMTDPHEITIGKKNSGSDNVSHIYYMVNARDRYLALKRIADVNPNIYGIVFCRTRMETKEVADNLIKDGYNADALHGDLSQAQRDHVMNRFRMKNLQMLVATDVAARGLDVNDLTHVINYNLPDDMEVYNHRSGRTGRAGKSGVSIAIVHSREKSKIKDIERKINKSFERKMVPNGKEICEKQLFTLVDKMEKVEIDDSQIEPFLPQVYNKLEWLSREDLIKRFVSVEFNRFLEYYKNAPDINVTEKEKGKESKDNTRGNGNRNSDFTRFFINLGERDNVKTPNLIGLINETTRRRDIEIGKVDIMKNFSFFEIEKQHTDTILAAFDGIIYEGRKLAVEITHTGRGERSSSRDRDRKSDRERSFSRDRDRGRDRNRDRDRNKDKGKRRDSRKPESGPRDRKRR